jgi:hypothetical protein
VALFGGRPGLELRSSRELLSLEERELVDGSGTEVPAVRGKHYRD